MIFLKLNQRGTCYRYNLYNAATKISQRSLTQYLPYSKPNECVSSLKEQKNKTQKLRNLGATLAAISITETTSVCNVYFLGNHT